MDPELKKTSITSEWMKRHSKLYDSAIQAPFILSIRDGTLDFSLYTRWLEQDYLFVKEFVRYLGSILAKAPDSASDEDVDLLLGGLNALQEELAWFRSQAAKWSLSFDRTTRHETTDQYCKFLKQLSAPNVEYPVALATLWIIEASYNESFATCLESDAMTAPKLKEACQRWGSPEFKNYCMGLKEMADKALQKASPESQGEAEHLFEQVLTHEIAFWSMSFNEKP